MMETARRLFLRRLAVCVWLILASAANAQRESNPFEIEVVADFQSPWAMTFLPDASLLITDLGGELYLFKEGQRQAVSGVPDVAVGGQGGLGDVILHPDFTNNNLIYLSYAEAGEDDFRGAAVARARLQRSNDGGAELRELEVIWRQQPKVQGEGHYSHRMAFGPDKFLWITSGDRQKMTPAQDMNSNLGKVIRLKDDGSVPEDNPFANQGEVSSQIWSLGHRNMLGIVFDEEGRLWVHEMGPKGGDELNLIERGKNYGWPEVSNGVHYDDKAIPDHATRPDDFEAPVITWTPVISPAGFIIYEGSEFPQWQGSGLIGGLSSKSLVRIEFDGDQAREVERFDMGERIREVEQGPEGDLWLLEDGRQNGQGRLLRLKKKS